MNWYHPTTGMENCRKWNLPVKSYTNRIFGYVGNRLVKVLTGQRGVGKGCLLRQIIYQLIADGVSSRNILYISKKFTDSGVLSGYRDLDDLLFIYREKIHPVGKVYIFIEEIQKWRAGNILSIPIHRTL